MRFLGCASILAMALLGGAAGAAQEAESGVVHVNGVRNPETHPYRAIVAGLDSFDEHHALAPNAPGLLFQARTRGGRLLRPEMLKTGAMGARLSGDAFSLALPLDEEGRFEVPRSQRALDADAELVMSKKHSAVRVWPYVRSPGLGEDQRRLGDIRLECRVFTTIAKKEAPLHLVLLANAAMLGSDWCAALNDRQRTWSVFTPARLVSAVLHDGGRSMALKVNDSAFRVPIGDTSWSNDAIVELEYAAPAEPSQPTLSMKEAAP
jgi:hypothetical protein